jgi:GTP-binding protein
VHHPPASPRPGGSIFSGAVYTASAQSLRDLPPPGPPEIAFAGRSNAGKSSALNALARHKRLAFTSKLPGRTQLINFFALRSGGLLVDLPGYGYARVPATVREHWGKVVADYLSGRSSLKGLGVIMDVRNPLTHLDEQLLDWFAPRCLPVHVLLTKSDKLPRRQAGQALETVRAQLAKWGPGHSVQLFSSLSGSGLDDAEAVLAPWLGLSPELSGQSQNLNIPDVSIKEGSAREAEKKKPRAEGETPGDKKSLNLRKAPAQGGEAGDDKTSPADMESSSRKRFRRF